MRRVSHTARLAQEGQQSDEIEVILVIVEHPDIPGGIIRLSTDPAERFSVQPLLYGTRSTWRSPGGQQFLFTVMDALVPDEKDDAAAQGSLVLELLDSDIGDVLTSTTVQATCHLAVVMASSPNIIEGEWLDLKMTGAVVDSGQAVLQFSTESIYDEPWPADRMTKERFPGLHR